jgi:sugar phosphate isomerase/epimerase
MSAPTVQVRGRSNSSEAVDIGAVTAPPVSVQLYSLRTEAAADFGAVITRLGEIGFAGVELAGFHGMAPTEFAQRAHDAGLVVSSGHVNTLERDALQQTLDDLATVRCPAAILAFLPPDQFDDVASIDANAERINEAAQWAHERGMTFGYHNHWWEFEKSIDGRTAWTHLFDRLQPDIAAELDIYWATVGGADPLAAVAQHRDRVRFVHVKDGPADSPKSPMVAVGSGTLDITRVVTGLPSAQWHIVELDHCATDMFDAIQASHRWLTTNGLSRARV